MNWMNPLTDNEVGTEWPGPTGIFPPISANSERENSNPFTSKGPTDSQPKLWDGPVGPPDESH